MTSVVIRGGRLYDPAQGIDRVGDLFIENGRIAKEGRGEEEIKAKGLLVVPGLIDMHVHLREPGKEAAETIASGAAAAIAGGLTTIAAMPNTEPAVDTEAAAEFVVLQGKRAGMANVLPIGAVTKGRQGVELAEMGQLLRGGAVAFSDDGSPIQNADVMRRALQYTKMFDRAIISHAEDRDIAGSGVMNDGKYSMILGLSGMSRVAEEIMVSRDIALAAVTGGKLHIAHISVAGTVDLVRAGKGKGVRVTAEATPHHFTLTDECVRGYDPVYKMNPPLRTQADVDAVRKGLADGTIDVIATDHAPHATEDKEVEFAAAPFGVIGMETLLPLVMTELVHKGILTFSQAIAKLTVNPARVLGIAKGTLAPGADADVTILDPNREWTIDPSRFRSKSRNCPFAGRKVRGRAVAVVVGGVVHTLE